MYALKAFTDNIVIGWPIRGDAEYEMGDAFFKVGAFQFQMAIEGFFVRGAISVGDAYVDGIAVFGSALVEAYKGETELARDPRVIVAKSAVEVVKQHLKYYPDQEIAGTFTTFCLIRVGSGSSIIWNAFSEQKTSKAPSTKNSRRTKLR